MKDKDDLSVKNQEVGHTLCVLHNYGVIENEGNQPAKKKLLVSIKGKFVLCMPYL